ncbi:MAG: 5-(carboxyamino)imidazole ribonucleotide synthase [Fervidobacterium sp.]
MKKASFPFKSIGIIGGGQLGKMLTIEAKRMGFRVIALDPDPDCPVSHLCDELIVGSLYDEGALKKLVEKSDVVTYEIEHVNVKVLIDLYNKGYEIQPSPHILETISDKVAQKEFLTSHGLPTPYIFKVDLSKSEDLEDMKSLLDKNNITFPFVQKTRRGGYDGRGVFVVKNVSDLKNIMKAESYIEEFVHVEKELSVLVARNKSKEVKIYDVVEMVFDKNSNILDYLISPARISENISSKAKQLAVEVVSKFDGVGVFAIEMFLLEDGDILINEIAPRVHNSGHHTIESCFTNQFQQHIRAICNLPLGSTHQHSPAVMINLLGEDGYKGGPIIENFDEIFKIEGAHLHFYGKSQTFPKRKMGHVTIVDKDLERAIEKARYLKEKIRILGSEKLNSNNAYNT